MEFLQAANEISVPSAAESMNALFAVFLMAIVYGFKSVVQWWMGRTPKKIEAKKQAEETFATLVQHVKEIRNEITVNGGTTTIKDVLSIVSNDIKTQSEKIAVIESKMDKVIAQTRKRTELALNQSSVAQFMCNDQGEVTFVNDAMSELFGVGKHHLLRNKFLNFIDDQTIKEEIIRRFKFIIENKNQLTFEMKNVPIRNKSNKVKITIEPTVDDTDNFMWYLGKVIEMPN